MTSSLTLPDITQTAQECAALFHKAGLLHILPFLNNVTSETKEVDGTFEQVTEADIAASKFILKALREKFPAPYSEEEVTSDRHDKEILWQVDPLDGTTEFCEGLRDLFAVQGALLERNGNEFVPRAGVVHIPGRGESFWATQGEGVVYFAKGEPSQPSTRMKPVMEDGVLRCYVRKVDGIPFDLGERFYERVAARLGRRVKTVESGGSGAAFADLIRGDVDLVLFNIDYIKEWDTSMAEPLVQNFGGWICDLNGETLRYNKKGNIFHDNGAMASINVPQDIAIRQIRDGMLVQKRGKK